MRSLSSLVALGATAQNVITNILPNNTGHLFEPSAGPVHMKFEGPLLPDTYKRPLFNDYGFVLRGNTTEGEDWSLWLFMYRQIGNSEFIMPEDIFQLSLIHGAYSQEEKKVMHDNDFATKGQSVEDYRPTGTIKTKYHEDYVSWSYEGFTMERYHDHWEAHGIYNNITVDLTMYQRGDMVYHAGKFDALENCDASTPHENFDCFGAAGGIVHLQNVTGTLVTKEGKKMDLDVAHGVHERIMNAGVVPPRVEEGAGRGASWFHSWGEKVSWWSFYEDAGPFAVGLTNVDNQTYYTSGLPNVTIEEQASWIDPRSHFLVPFKWRTWQRYDDGFLESYGTGYARLYYYWLRNKGLITVYQYLGDSVTTFTRKDGSVLREKTMAFLEFMRDTIA